MVLALKNIHMRNIIILLLVFSFQLVSAQSKEAASKAFAENYKENITKSRINGVYIPKDVVDAMRQLERKSDANVLDSFKDAEEDLVAKKLHFGLGRWMIYNWNLEYGSRLSHYLTELGLNHHDDMAQLLIRCFHRYINFEDLNVVDTAKELREKRERKKKEKLKGKEIETLSSKPFDG